MSELEQLSLAADFPAATHEDWLKLVSSALKGADFEKRLVAKTRDGLRIEPLYQRVAHAGPIAGRTAATPWQILAKVDHPDPAVANEEAWHELENGATGLSLVFAGSAGARGYGIEATQPALARVFEGIHADAGIAIELDLGPHAAVAPSLVADLVERKGVAPEATGLRFGIDPLGAMATTGVSPDPWLALAPAFAAQVQAFARRGFRGPFAAADGRPVHDAGGSEAQELAFVLASALAYLRALDAAGAALDEARAMIFFRLSADADQFLTMAKFRALRLLWARVESACGLEPKPAFISAETAWRMMTRRDPFVNMLRTTIAAFAAGLGGANAITALPFTAAIGLPDRFARRVARNTQLVLIEEASLAKVADPAAGSGAVETLTGELCRAAWAQLQEIEGAGGLGAALEAGLIQAKVAKVRAEREKAVAYRRELLTGTTEFPDISELPVTVLEVARRDMETPAPSAVSFKALDPRRLAEPFEKLRDASDRLLREAGSRPRVFLANLGSPSALTARTGFAKNLFEAGGIEAATNEGFAKGGPAGESTTDLPALAAAFRTSGARLACLCSSDEVYAQEAATAAKALTAAGAGHVYLAARPGAHEAEWRTSVIETFVYAGCDALATLEAAHRAF